jgi:hypothetical protein
VRLARAGYSRGLRRTNGDGQIQDEEEKPVRVIFVVLNLLVDLIYADLDPRIRCQ